MSQQELVALIARKLSALGIPFMLTGSLVSSLQGEPRATHDIDVVVEMGEESIESFVSNFSGDRFYLSRSAMQEAVRTRRMFNLLDLESGNKVDFWMLTDEPFDQSRFARRRAAELDGVAVVVSMPEDTILMKLKWALASGGSEKQFGDALRVYELQASSLDQPYIESWLDSLGVREIYQRLVATAEPVES